MTRLVPALSAAALMMAGAFVFSDQPGRAPASFLVGAANAQEAAEVDTSTIAEMTMGAEDAPVTIVEYASYTCPHCADFEQGPFKKLKAEYIDTGKVRFIYREVYFDRYGLWASMIARCSGDTEKFFGISDLIFKTQRDWVRAGGPTEIVDELRKIGRLAGLENDTLEACLQDGTKAQTLVKWYQEHAEADKIDATPTFVINGEKVTNQPWEDLKALIEAEIAKQ
ncbi:DsbA family protein [Pseudodonghicola flavimaris]|uniref:DsbA family protein n=1 Tax=Pseudodonghicola flavimaris TaxID=3050036 RepID=A0ABT7EWU4_9RHOB|nr:DsbA family protein [Pseudodonghicola flavimaris]MDK3016812.1 DsbA family protein [Pseudodonghicola flavimaris]